MWSDCRAWLKSRPTPRSLLCLTGTPPLLEWRMEEVLGPLTISVTHLSAWDRGSQSHVGREVVLDRGCGAMKCQKCTKAATLHITEVLGEEQFDELHLCQECAEKYLYEPQQKGLGQKSGGAS